MSLHVGYISTVWPPEGDGETVRGPTTTPAGYVRGKWATREGVGSKGCVVGS